MNIILNNRPESFDVSTLTFEELIKKKNFTFKMLVTKLNGKLVKKGERSEVVISDGDNVTVLHLVSGG